MRSISSEIPRSQGDEAGKALALGADLVGMARPLLEAADAGDVALERTLEAFGRELRLSCFYCGRGWVGDLVAEDLRYAQDTLASITGEFTSDDLLGAIFSSFCIGK